MDPYQGDLSDPDALNKYTYARANPTSYADPTGNWAFSLHTLMIDTMLWFDARQRISDGFTNAPMGLAGIYVPGSGVMLTASEYLAPPKALHAWIGNSGAEDQVIGGLIDEASQGTRIRDPENGDRLYVPHNNFFALTLAQEVNSKVERDAELAQLAVTQMRYTLNTNGLLDRAMKNPRYDELNNWLETSYHTGFFKALQLGGDPMGGSMDISIYPAHTGLGPGAQEQFAPTASAMKLLRPKMAENPGGLFHSAVDYYHYVSTAGLPPLQWTEFMASGGWILQGLASTILQGADIATTLAGYAALGLVPGANVAMGVYEAADYVGGVAGAWAGGESLGDATGFNAAADGIGSLISQTSQLIGGNCYTAGTPVLLGDGTESLPIEQLRVGRRVRTSALHAEQLSTARMNTDEYRLVRCETGHIDGGTAVIETLMTQLEIQSRMAADGERLYLHLDELELYGWAKLLAVEKCPDIETGSGRLVKSRIVTTQKRDVLLLELEGSDTPIGVTAGHPLWSLDKGGWTHAGDLQPGERLQTANGETRIRSIKAAEGTHTVYNIEVETDHRYYVGDEAALSHNMSALKQAGKALAGSAKGKQALKAKAAQQKAAKAARPVAYGTPSRQLGSRQAQALQGKVDSRSITKGEWKRLQWQKRLDSRRQAGIDDFWVGEQSRLAGGGPGTRNWSAGARETIIKGGRPSGISSHHKYSVSQYPQLANDPTNIYPVTYYEHFNRWHGGNWSNSTNGVPLNPAVAEWF